MRQSSHPEVSHLYYVARGFNYEDIAPGDPSAFPNIVDAPTEAASLTITSLNVQPSKSPTETVEPSQTIILFGTARDAEVWRDDHVTGGLVLEIDPRSLTLETVEMPDGSPMLAVTGSIPVAAVLRVL